MTTDSELIQALNACLSPENQSRLQGEKIVVDFLEKDSIKAFDAFFRIGSDQSQDKMIRMMAMMMIKNQMSTMEKWQKFKPEAQEKIEQLVLAQFGADVKDIQLKRIQATILAFIQKYKIKTGKDKECTILLTLLQSQQQVENDEQGNKVFLTAIEFIIEEIESIPISQITLNEELPMILMNLINKTLENKRDLELNSCYQIIASGLKLFKGELSTKEDRRDLMELILESGTDTEPEIRLSAIPAIMVLNKEYFEDIKDLNQDYLKIILSLDVYEILDRCSTIFEYFTTIIELEDYQKEFDPKAGFFSSLITDITKVILELLETHEQDYPRLDYFDYDFDMTEEEQQRESEKEFAINHLGANSEACINFMTTLTDVYGDQGQKKLVKEKFSQSKEKNHLLPLMRLMINIEDPESQLEFIENEFFKFFKTFYQDETEQCPKGLYYNFLAAALEDINDPLAVSNSENVRAIIATGNGVELDTVSLAEYVNLITVIVEQAGEHEKTKEILGAFGIETATYIQNYIKLFERNEDNAFLQLKLVFNLSEAVIALSFCEKDRSYEQNSGILKDLIKVYLTKAKEEGRGFKPRVLQNLLICIEAITSNFSLKPEDNLISEILSIAADNLIPNETTKSNLLINQSLKVLTSLVTNSQEAMKAQTSKIWEISNLYLQSSDFSTFNHFINLFTELIALDKQIGIDNLGTLLIYIVKRINDEDNVTRKEKAQLVNSISWLIQRTKEYNASFIEEIGMIISWVIQNSLHYAGKDRALREDLMLLRRNGQLAVSNFIAIVITHDKDKSYQILSQMSQLIIKFVDEMMALMQDEIGFQCQSLMILCDLIMVERKTKLNIKGIEALVNGLFKLLEQEKSEDAQKATEYAKTVFNLK